ncbi:MAG: DUF3048 domain-containing protein [Patescibacteria group bacterium]
MSHRSKIYLAITVIFVAVILLGIGIFNFLSQNKKIIKPVINNDIKSPIVYRHILNGSILENPDQEFFAIAIMFDNAYDARPQYGLDKADIVYEALAEGNITRLLGIFDSRQNIDKIGSVRSARPYFMDWADEYAGIYMHVGGSPDALANINNYSFYNIDQIGVGEIYFWRDNNLDAPHNVFTSSSNWLRVGEIKEISKINTNINWNFVESEDNLGIDFSLDYNEPYKVDWKYSDQLQAYLRWQGDNKFIYNTGEQVRAANVIVQIVDSKIIDEKVRRKMNTQEGGQAFVFNKIGRQDGTWEVVDGRTRFFDAEKNELKLVAGQTWVQVIPTEEYLITE